MTLFNFIILFYISVIYFYFQLFWNNDSLSHFQSSKNEYRNKHPQKPTIKKCYVILYHLCYTCKVFVIMFLIYKLKTLVIILMTLHFGIIGSHICTNFSEKYFFSKNLRTSNNRKANISMSSVATLL